MRPLQRTKHRLFSTSTAHLTLRQTALARNGQISRKRLASRFPARYPLSRPIKPQRENDFRRDTVSIADAIRRRNIDPVTLRPIQLDPASDFVQTMLENKTDKATADLLQHAAYLSSTWPEAIMLDRPRKTLADAQDATPMTTNFLVSSPPSVLHGLRGGYVSKAEILAKVHLLMLKRRPDANPLPSAWTAVSGKLERHSPNSSSSQPSNDSSSELQAWEIPVLGAAREIAEETALQVYQIRLKAALQPYLIETAGRRYQVWPLLWHRAVPGRRFSVIPMSEGIGRSEADVLASSVMLNEENVECRWERLSVLSGLHGVVPGLMETFERLVDAWILSDARRPARVERWDDDEDY